MARSDLPPGAAHLVRADGSVVVPPSLASEVLRIILRDVGVRVRADGGELSTAVRGLLWALHAGAQAAEDAAGSAAGTPVAGAASVEVSTAEAARRMGCSESYARRLARSGQVPARKTAGVWLITRAADAAEDDEEAA
ncbi:helix-turn-helix domain-containing protein [Streptomyces sp. NPDC057596]|uniref:helix-turn-helix domain-containing protein n=1 Tax=Streptomyces sp. NPDC057596 TaxID=3346178 RepID=UPI00367AE71C